MGLINCEKQLTPCFLAFGVMLSKPLFMYLLAALKLGCHSSVALLAFFCFSGISVLFLVDCS